MKVNYFLEFFLFVFPFETHCYTCLISAMSQPHFYGLSLIEINKNFALNKADILRCDSVSWPIFSFTCTIILLPQNIIYIVADIFRPYRMPRECEYWLADHSINKIIEIWKNGEKLQIILSVLLSLCTYVYIHFNHASRFIVQFDAI